MQIKLYNGLNRFAPGPRLNFRYFPWVPGRQTSSISTTDLLPFSASLSACSALPSLSPSLSPFSVVPLLDSLFSSSPFDRFTFPALCSTAANPLIPRDAEHARPAPATPIGHFYGRPSFGKFRDKGTRETAGVARLFVTCRVSSMLPIFSPFFPRPL